MSSSTSQHGSRGDVTGAADASDAGRAATVLGLQHFQVSSIWAPAVDTCSTSRSCSTVYYIKFENLDGWLRGHVHSSQQYEVMAACAAAVVSCKLAPAVFGHRLTADA